MLRQRTYALLSHKTHSVVLFLPLSTSPFHHLLPLVTRNLISLSTSLSVDLFLKHNCHKTLIENIVIQYFYTFQNDHYAKFSYLTLPYKGITLLFTTFPFVIESFYLLIFLTYSSHPPLWWPPVCSLCLCFCFAIPVHWFGFLDSTYKWNRVLFVFLCLTFHLYDILQFHPCHNKWQNFILQYKYLFIFYAE